MNSTIYAPYTMYKREGVIPWVASEGGPLLLLSLSEADLWNGVGSDVRLDIDASHPSSGTDYSRACAAVNEDVGLILVGGAEALVIGCCKNEVGVLKDERCGLLFIRSERMDDENEAIATLRAEADALIWNAMGLTLPLTGDALLFDSAMSGEDAKHEGQSFLIPMQSGRYQVHAAVFQPDEWTKLNVYRFTATQN